MRISAFAGISDFFVIGLISRSANTNKTTKPKSALNNTSLNDRLEPYRLDIYSPSPIINCVLKETETINPVRVVNNAVAIPFAN